MLSVLKGDALCVFTRYTSGAMEDPCEALDAHRAFATELLCDDAVTTEEVRESVRSLIRALNYVTTQRNGRPAESNPI